MYVVWLLHSLSGKILYIHVLGSCSSFGDSINDIGLNMYVVWLLHSLMGKILYIHVLGSCSSFGDSIGGITI